MSEKRTQVFKPKIKDSYIVYQPSKEAVNTVRLRVLGKSKNTVTKGLTIPRDMAKTINVKVGDKVTVIIDKRKWEITVAK